MIGRLLLIIATLLGTPLAAQNNASEQSSVTDDNELCTKLFQKTVVAYQDLHRRLPPTVTLPANSPLVPLLSMHIGDCAQSGTMDQIEKALASHAGKVALLLPFSKLPKSVGQEILRSVHDWMKSKGLSPERLIIWRDTDGNREKMEKQLAQMVWTQNISIVIGGLMHNEAPLLAQWTDRLRLPAVILNRKPEGQASKYNFYMKPDHRLLASALGRFAVSRNLRRVAILQPQFAADEGFVASFLTQARQIQLQVSEPLVYNPADFSSIDAIIRKLFHIDDESRKEELLEMMTKAKENAAQLRVPFNAKGLVLPPLVDVDAILIADHFKNVRHISKVLAFYGVKRVQLMGIAKWRAFELVDPVDENLVGSVFIDYLGSYKQLPYGIQVPTVDREYFAEGAQAGAADLQVVVHHALFSALQALTGNRGPRYSLYKRLEAAPGLREGMLAAPLVYRPDHTANWPTFLFGVGSGSISILQTWNPLQVPSRTSSNNP